METGTKPLVSHLHVLFFPCVVQKAMAEVETKTLNMRHQAQKRFCGIFVGIPQHQKGYFVYVTSTRKVILSYDVVFDEKYSSVLSYTSQPYMEAIAMCHAVTYTPYATSSKEQTGDVVMFAQFEEWDLLTETRNDTEIGDEYESESIMMSEQGMKNIDGKEEFDDNHISTETLHDICDRNQTHPNIDKMEASLKISD